MSRHRTGANNLGRPRGTLNKITRTMKDAAVAAAEELGHIPYKDWAKSLVGDRLSCKGHGAARRPAGFHPMTPDPDAALPRPVG
jgi:hypothetical protein